MARNRKIKITIGQMKVAQGDTGKNLEKMISIINEAAANKADLVCLPELAYTRYFLEFKELQQLAEPVDGPFVQTLSKLAQEKGVYIIAGYAESVDIPGRMYNSAVFIDNKGYTIGNMRKVYTPAALVTWGGLKAVGMTGKYMSIVMVVLIVILTGASLVSKDADLGRLFVSNWKYAIPVFNVAAFSYIGQYLVPDLARGLAHEPKKLASSLMIGQILVAALLIMIPLGCFAVSPADKTSQVATIACGRVLALIAKANQVYGG